MRKTRRSKGRNVEFYYVLYVTPTMEQPAEFHSWEELKAHQRENFRTLLYDDFSELMQPLNSQIVSR
jgi:hypothetical protein